jgi:hypothetical protein
MTHYRQLNIADRQMIAHLIKIGKKPAYIARVLGRNRSTIKRELDRNSYVDNSGKMIYEYRQAQTSYRLRKVATGSGKNRQLNTNSSFENPLFKWALFVPEKIVRRERKKESESPSKFEVRIGALNFSYPASSPRRKISGTSIFSSNIGKNISARKTSVSPKRRRKTYRSIFEFRFSQSSRRRKTYSSRFETKLSTPIYNKVEIKNRTEISTEKNQRQEQQQHLKQHQKIKILTSLASPQVRPVRRNHSLDPLGRKQKIKARAVAANYQLPRELKKSIPPGKESLGVSTNAEINLSKIYNSASKAHQHLKIQLVARNRRHLHHFR